MDVAETSPVRMEELREAARNDTRPTLPEPPPVMLVSVGDVTLDAPAGAEAKLDDFYVRLLAFERDADGLAFHAEKYAIRFRVVAEPEPRDDRRPLGIVTPRFDEIVEMLEHERIPYDRVRGLVAGEDGLLLRDPAGNWLAVGDLQTLR